jgi:hypothetical protein
MRGELGLSMTITEVLPEGIEELSRNTVFKRTSTATGTFGFEIW